MDSEQDYDRGPCLPVTQGQGDSATPRERQKRTAVNVPVPPTSKRLRGLAASTNPQDLMPLHQIKIVRRAAASLPAPYYVHEQGEAAERIQAARAVDCWYLTVGKDRETEPSEDLKAALQISHQNRLEEALMVLRKPQTSRIRCTECLKFGHWKTWKNNHNGGSAYHIREHLVKEHYSAYLAACERINYIPTDQRGPVSSEDDVKEPLTPEGIVRYLTEWFAEDDISFNMVSHRGFRRFVSYIGQGKVTAKDLPDRHSIAAKAAALSEEAKSRIKKEIKHARGRVSCTTDLWSDDSQRSFMCITVHFHNRHMRQVNRLVAFCVIEGSHAGSHLAETFFEVMEEFGIVRKLGWITMDNANNNDSMMAQLEEYMIVRGLDFDRHENRLRCFPHVVNLAVQDILSALTASATEYRNSVFKQGYILDDELEVYHLGFGAPTVVTLGRTPVHIIAMALNPSIRYEWFDQHCSPEEALNARVVVKQHMLRCLEEQQKESSKAVDRPLNPPQGPTETATKQLNTGYSSLLTSGVETRPASRSFPTPAKSSSTSTPLALAVATASTSTVSTHTITPVTPRRPTSNRVLNEATVELEHRKFEEEAAIAPEEMNGLTQIDYWLVIIPSG
ncbi:hypothetical protein RSOLAG22IIIB_06998 [Rhizoctonia solani]|uniref:AC transposase n=1 Tax=Rhizoctonia solani TaxID=456999 RepID=A0A0K6GI78_9AGAM|nr:hypothetical protein RSOLAG22IIIB_06998 [Rhizoctonia solani]